MKNHTTIKRVKILVHGNAVPALRRDLPPVTLASGWSSLIHASKQYSIDNGKTWFDAR